MRKVRRPERLTEMGTPVIDSLNRWQFCDERFPDRYFALVQHHQEPDPYSPASKRVCHNTTIHVGGIALVDLGWLIPGEEPPPGPVAGVHLNLGLIGRAAQAFPFSEHGASQSGMPYGERWPEFLRTMELTAVSLALDAVRGETLYPCTVFFQARCQNAGKFDAAGMLEWLPLLSAAHLSSREWV